MDQQASAALEQLAVAVAQGNRDRVLLLANSLSGTALDGAKVSDLELHRAIAAVLADFGAIDPAMDAHARVLQAMAAGNPDPREVLAEIDALSALAEAKGDLERAARLQAIAIDLTRTIDGEDSASLYARMDTLADLRGRMGDAAGAAALRAEIEALKTQFSPAGEASGTLTGGPAPSSQPDPEALSRLRRSPAAAAPAPPPATMAPARKVAGDATVESVGGALENAGEPVKEPQSYQTVEVFFSTSRKPTGSDNPYRHFSGRRNGDVVPVHTYGIAEVSVPAKRKLGSLPIPGWFSRYPGYHNDDLYLLKRIRELGRDDFDRQLTGRIASRPGREGLLFIHGFNVDFWGAMLRAAQLAADLDIDGAVAAYSWPSRGNVLCYISDRQEIIAPHVDELKRLILTMARAQGVKRVTVIAHSMGCEFLLQALEKIQLELSGAPKGSAPLIKDVIFAAPDVDIAQFAGVVSKLDAVAGRVSVYCSERDSALAWGRRLISSYDRAGNRADRLAMLVTGDKTAVDTIDTTEASSGFLGHADFATSAMDDLRAIVWLSLIPQRRPTLSEKGNGDGPSYWVYKTADEAAGSKPFREALSLARTSGGIAPALAAIEKQIATLRDKPEASEQVRAHSQIALALTSMA